MSKNSNIDSYIAEKTPFAQEILTHLRQIIHNAAPGITETIKWRQPCFEHNGLVCSVAAFKKHVTFSFFKGKLLNDSNNIFPPSDNNELTSLKFCALADIPQDDILIAYIEEAIALNADSNSKRKSTQRKDKATLIIPNDLAAALATSTSAQITFNNFSYSKQKDYIEWLTSAKRENTRVTRLATTVQWLSEGKALNWKYENC